MIKMSWISRSLRARSASLIRRLAPRHLDVAGGCPRGCGSDTRAHRGDQFAAALRVIGGIHDGVGFDGIADAVSRDLIIARIVEPTSKRTGCAYSPIWVQKSCPTKSFSVTSPGSRPTGIATPSLPSASLMPLAEARCACCSTTSPHCISEPRTKTTCARSAIPRDAAWIRRSSSIGGHHHRGIAQVAAGGEGGDDRDQGGRFGGIALEAADLQRENLAINKQADHVAIEVIAKYKDVWHFERSFWMSKTDLEARPHSMRPYWLARNPWSD